MWMWMIGRAVVEGFMCCAGPVRCLEWMWMWVWEDEVAGLVFRCLPVCLQVISRLSWSSLLHPGDPQVLNTSGYDKRVRFKRTG